MSFAFVSYTLRDGVLDLASLEEIADSIRGPYEFAYVDVLHNRSHRPQEYLEEVLRSSKSLYLVMTPGALMSRWVLREIALAERMRIPVTAVAPTSTQRLVGQADHDNPSLTSPGRPICALPSN